MRACGRCSRTWSRAGACTGTCGATATTRREQRETAAVPPSGDGRLGRGAEVSNDSPGGRPTQLRGPRHPDASDQAMRQRASDRAACRRECRVAWLCRPLRSVSVTSNSALARLVADTTSRACHRRHRRRGMRHTGRIRSIGVTSLTCPRRESPSPKPDSRGGSTYCGKAALTGSLLLGTDVGARREGCAPGERLLVV